MPSLSRTAGRFRAAFPDVVVQEQELASTLEAFDSAKAPLLTRLTSLAGALLLTPPVDDLAAPFAHELLAAALVRHLADPAEADEQAARIIDGLLALGGKPLFGLRISIGAPRRGVLVTTLRHLDLIIESLHERLLVEFAQPLGPQEHSADHGSLGGMDTVPSRQWQGHVTTSCVPSYSHDLLLVLPGRSIGVGESLSIARSLQIPVFAADVPLPKEDPASPGGTPVEAGTPNDSGGATEASHGDGGVSCRLDDSELVSRITCDSSLPEDIPEEIVAQLLGAAPLVRRRQRRRVRHILELNDYRCYLLRAPLIGAVSDAARRRVSDPFEFASLTELQRDELATDLGAMKRADYELLPLLGRTASAGLDDFLSSPGAPVHAAGQLLRAGLREMAQFADEPLKAARPFVWDTEGWRRLWENLN